MAKKYRITLTAEEREVLGRMIARGKAAARKLAHARVLLQADEGGPARADEDLAAALNVSVRTIERVRQRFVEQGLEAALLPPRPRSGSMRASSMASGRPTSSPWPAPRRRRARGAGPCGSWPNRWWNFSMWMRCPTRRCARRSQKRAEAAPETNVVHSAEAIGRVCLPHGGRAGGLLPPL